MLAEACHYSIDIHATLLISRNQPRGFSLTCYAFGDFFARIPSRLFQHDGLTLGEIDLARSDEFHTFGLELCELAVRLNGRTY